LPVTYISEDGVVVLALFKLIVPLLSDKLPLILTVGKPVLVTEYNVPPPTFRSPILNVLADVVVFKLSVPAFTFKVVAKLMGLTALELI
jgi:hypothetical protein